MKRVAFGLTVVVLSFGGVPEAAAQNVVRRGDGDVFLDHRIDRMLRSGRYLAVASDTTIAAGDTVRTDLLVLGSRLYLEGTVLGDVFGVDAELFLRPGATVGRDVVNVGGGLYASEDAHLFGRTLDRPLSPYAVHRRGDQLVIVSSVERDPLQLDGLYGFRIPRYNRVDGLALDWGATYRFRALPGGVTPGVRGTIGYRTDRGDLAGGGSAFLEWRRWALEGGWLRRTRSNDRWIRGDLRNSTDFAFDGGDMRNYYEADVAFGELRRLLGNDEGRRYLAAGVRYQQEDARSLTEGNPWAAFGPDELRDNPPIDEGEIRSIIPFVDTEWLTARTATEARLEVEQASFDVAEPGFCLPTAECTVPRDGGFTRLRLDAEFGMLAILDHTLEVEVQVFLPLAGDEPLPRQRWGMLGGSGTIRTLADAAFLGDHLLYTETEYIIPIGFVQLPLIGGSPTFELLHSAGRAWTGEREGDFVQNVGARLNVFAFFARYLVDPASGQDEVTVGVSWPFDDDEYPWQE